MCVHPGVQLYVEGVLDSLVDMLDHGGHIEQISVCVNHPTTKETLEQFIFDIQAQTRGVDIR